MTVTFAAYLVDGEGQTCYVAVAKGGTSIPDWTVRVAEKGMEKCYSSGRGRPPFADERHATNYAKAILKERKLKRGFVLQWSSEYPYPLFVGPVGPADVPSWFAPANLTTTHHSTTTTTEAAAAEEETNHGEAEPFYSWQPRTTP